MNPINAIDFYKVGHIDQYPIGTTEVYSNFTARKEECYFFGLKYVIERYFKEMWTSEFFDISLKPMLDEYSDIVQQALGCKPRLDHIQALHKIGYLPLEIKALPEHIWVPAGVPLLTIRNTHPDFYWLTNYIETALSAMLWKPITVATRAGQLARIASNQFQFHDFSMRGMSGLEDAAICGAAHLEFFKGTDCLPAILLRRKYYDKNFIAYSVPATEHSVMCAYGQSEELNLIKHLITDVYPSGIVSIVCDSWDFWKVINEYLPILKDIIVAREGKVVIRPDSGDPVEIVPKLIERLDNIFGSMVDENGYRVLDSHIGAIYGDSITLERATKILDTLRSKGYSPDNIVFGIGSYTYNYITRDTLGFAMKATSCVVNGERRTIFKDPITDNGTKRSAKGLLRVDENLVLHQAQTEEQANTGMLIRVF